jgi:hypothetical protein
MLACETKRRASREKSWPRGRRAAARHHLGGGPYASDYG